MTPRTADSRMGAGEITLQGGKNLSGALRS
jgi:hypothetical protein